MARGTRGANRGTLAKSDRVATRGTQHVLLLQKGWSGRIPTLDHLGERDIERRLPFTDAAVIEMMPRCVAKSRSLFVLTR